MRSAEAATPEIRRMEIDTISISGPDAECGERGGHHVHERHGRRHNCRGRDAKPRACHHERHSQRRVVHEEAVTHFVVFAESLTVVPGEDDERRVCQGAERGDDAARLPVRNCNLVVVPFDWRGRRIASGGP